MRSVEEKFEERIETQEAKIEDLELKKASWKGLGWGVTLLVSIVTVFMAFYTIKAESLGEEAFLTEKEKQLYNENLIHVAETNVRQSNIVNELGEIKDDIKCLKLSVDRQAKQQITYRQVVQAVKEGRMEGK